MANIWEPGLPPKTEPPEDNGGQAFNRMRVVGINLVILAFYTVICAITGGGPLLDTLLLFLHVSTCLILAIVHSKSGWLLSALAVLLIGFSTCVEILWKL